LPRPNNIAIDGPAGSGKSSISQRLAEKFGYIFVDTGAIYRALTHVTIQAEISITDTARIIQNANQTRIEVLRTGASNYRIIANGEDVSAHLHTKTVEMYVSAIARIPEIRTLMLPLQRHIAEQGNVIMAGRDIGTVVLPEADLKLYIDASLKERARRRYAQMLAEGKSAVLEAIENAMAERDKNDSERSTAPLAQAPDAIYLMTDSHTLEDVVQRISEIMENWQKP
jgi:cytidylate kinase